MIVPFGGAAFMFTMSSLSWTFTLISSTPLTGQRAVFVPTASTEHPVPTPSRSVIVIEASSVKTYSVPDDVTVTLLNSPRLPT